MRQLKLLVEAKDFDLRPIDTIVESVKQEDGSTSKNYYIEGPFIQTESKNRNGRKYKLQKMVECVQKYVNERMNPNFGFRSFGELGHPEGVEINLDRVSHYTNKLEWNGNDCIGKAEIITENPCGRIVETLLKKKLRLGVSTRGLGSLSDRQNQDGSKDVDTYEMIAIDIVADPSAPKGFVDGILENKEYIIKDGGVIVECYNNLERVLTDLPTHSDDKNKLFLKAFENFLKDFSKK